MSLSETRGCSAATSAARAGRAAVDGVLVPAQVAGQPQLGVERHQHLGVAGQVVERLRHRGGPDPDLAVGAPDLGDLREALLVELGVEADQQPAARAVVAHLEPALDQAIPEVPLQGEHVAGAEVVGLTTTRAAEPQAGRPQHGHAARGRALVVEAQPGHVQAAARAVAHHGEVVELVGGVVQLRRADARQAPAGQVLLTTGQHGDRPVGVALRGHAGAVGAVLAAEGRSDRHLQPRPVEEGPADGEQPERALADHHLHALADAADLAERQPTELDDGGHGELTLVRGPTGHDVDRADQGPGAVQRRHRPAHQLDALDRDHRDELRAEVVDSGLGERHRPPVDHHLEVARAGARAAVQATQRDVVVVEVVADRQPRHLGQRLGDRAVASQLDLLARHHPHRRRAALRRLGQLGRGGDVVDQAGVGRPLVGADLLVVHHLGVIAAGDLGLDGRGRAGVRGRGGGRLRRPLHGRPGDAVRLHPGLALGVGGDRQRAQQGQQYSGRRCGPHQVHSPHRSRISTGAVSSLYS